MTGLKSGSGDDLWADEAEPDESTADEEVSDTTHRADRDEESGTTRVDEMPVESTNERSSS